MDQLLGNASQQSTPNPSPIPSPIPSSNPSPSLIPSQSVEQRRNISLSPHELKAIIQGAVREALRIQSSPEVEVPGSFRPNPSKI